MKWNKIYFFFSLLFWWRSESLNNNSLKLFHFSWSSSSLLNGSTNETVERRYCAFSGPGSYAMPCHAAECCVVGPQPLLSCLPQSVALLLCSDHFASPQERSFAIHPLPLPLLDDWLYLPCDYLFANRKQSAFGSFLLFPATSIHFDSCETRCVALRYVARLLQV